MKFDLEEQLQHGEGRYQVVVEGRVVQEEVHLMSPATRWYTQEQSIAVYREAGFVDVHPTNGLSFEPAAGDERIWTVFGRRP